MTRIVVLNGPSSAGKSTLAEAVRELRGPRAVVVPIDRFYAMVHTGHPNDWAMYAALTGATFGAAAGFARAGFDVIVDIVFERRDCFEIAERVLAGFDPLYVAITASVEELERREQVRGDRPVGLARRQYAQVLHDVPYALALDTTHEPATSHANRVASLFA
jgi:chloramphenicol 3-O phosphotransferase